MLIIVSKNLFLIPKITCRTKYRYVIHEMEGLGGWDSAADSVDAFVLIGHCRMSYGHKIVVEERSGTKLKNTNLGNAKVVAEK